MALPGVRLRLCQRFCESARFGSTSTLMSCRNPRMFTFERLTANANSGRLQLFVLPPTVASDPMICGALNSWFLNIWTF